MSCGRRPGYNPLGGGIAIMQWSKLKSRVKARICPEMRRRVDFHVTSYRHSHDEAEKVWITLDGSRIATFSWYQKQWKPALRDKRGRLVRRNGLIAESQPSDQSSRTSSPKGAARSSEVRSISDGASGQAGVGAISPMLGALAA